MSPTRTEGLPPVIAWASGGPRYGAGQRCDHGEGRHDRRTYDGSSEHVLSPFREAVVANAPAKVRGPREARQIQRTAQVSPAGRFAVNTNFVSVLGSPP